MTEKLRCPIHRSILVQLADLDMTTRVWTAVDLWWCRKCQGARMEAEIRAKSGVSVTVNPGPTLCNRCHHEGVPCLLCRQKVCWGHTASASKSNGVLVRTCRACWALAHPEMPGRPKTVRAALPA